MNGKIEIELNGIKVTVLGGPFRGRPAGIKGVKLAQEITMEASVVLDIPDYQVPSVEATIEALVETFKILREDGVIYVGCFGGIGRTGMFMALIASIAAVDRMVHPPLKGLFGHLWAEFFGLSVYKKTPDWCKAVRSDPISYIRAAYMPHAVETEDQKKFIHLFPIMENLEKIVPQR